MRNLLIITAIITALLVGAGSYSALLAQNGHTQTMKNTASNHPPTPSRLAVATFAGGCFWCMQPPFDRTPGVVKTIVGYTGGSEPNPTYELVGTGKTRYAEAVQVTFDPAAVSYQQLLDVFWRNIDPTQGDGQFADRGPQYRTAIFFHNEEQRSLAEASKRALQESSKFGRPIVTEIAPATDFYRAEEYHQDYYKTNETHYNLYKVGSGRAGFIERTWGNGH